MRGVCSLHLPIMFFFRIQCFGFYHVCTYFFFVVYCCRGILLIFSYYNVRRMFVASRTCACIMQFPFELNASVFTICACINNLSFFFLLPIYHISPCISQYHSYYSFPFHGARVVRAFPSSFSFNYCMIIQASASLHK